MGENKWERMIVLYVANETISPSFVEGALIQRHKGILNASKIRWTKLNQNDHVILAAV